MAGGDGGGWRLQLALEARRRIVAKIFETLTTSLPADLTEGLIDLQRVADRLEWRMYSLACSQSDYLRRLALKMLHFESPFQLPQLDLSSHELNHNLEGHHKDIEACPCQAAYCANLLSLLRASLLASASNQYQYECSTETLTNVFTAEGLLDRDPQRSQKNLRKDDRLSDLPDAMLHHIMSFLSAVEAARTCVLSRRWRLLWTLVPCLDISVHQFGNDRVRFSNFVDHLLLMRGTASLDTLRLHSFAIDRASNWIDHAIKHNVKVLEFTEDTRWEPLYLDPQSVAFASGFLKCLKLTNVALDANVFDLLRHACPSLETLQLIRSFFETPEICSNSLKNLDIVDCSLSEDLTIHAPKMMSLCFESPQSNLSIITAAVTLCDLSSAKKIELSSSVREVRFAGETQRCPIFEKLTDLSLGEWCLSDNLSPLVGFLTRSPVLEKLTLKLQVECYGKETNVVCLRKGTLFSLDHLKKATIFCREGDARVAVLTTMLRANAKSLSVVDIKCY